MSSTLRAIFGVIITLVAVLAHGEVYRWVDSQGNVEFSDQPREGAEKIEVKEPATISLPKPSDVPRLQTPAEPFRYTSLGVSFPINDSAFFSGDGNFTVMVDVQPLLRGSHTINLLMDGVTVGVGRTVNFNLENVDRGTHSLVVRITDETGQVFQEGEPSTFTIHRPSTITGG